MEKARLWTAGFVLDTLINLGIYIIYYMLMVVISVEALNMGASVAEAGLATGIYIVGVLLARLLAGRYIELVGRKSMLYKGIGFYLLTTVLYFSFDSLIIKTLEHFSSVIIPESFNSNRNSDNSD